MLLDDERREEFFNSKHKEVSKFEVMEALNKNHQGIRKL